MLKLARYAVMLLIFSMVLSWIISSIPPEIAHSAEMIPTPHAWIRHAEHDAIRTLHRLTPYCAAKGKAAEAWAEVNSTQPNGYEVLGGCVG